jgi:sulfhydrogenase subunit beta (sulfur reductase)
MKYLILPKEKFDTFIERLAHDQKVVAPVKKSHNNYTFEEVRSGKEISVQYIPTILPPKKYFMPQYETLLEYNTTEGQKMEAVVEPEDLILFGVHTCDLAGIQCLNTVFSGKPKDINYLIRKNRITIIGLECNDYCDSFASCALMNNELPNGGYDLFFTDIGDRFIVHVNTYAGDKLTEKTGVFTEATGKDIEQLEELRLEKRKIFKNEVNIDLGEITAMFDRSLKSKIWDEIGDRCLSCGNCTNVCPTCYCFDMMDEPNLDLKTGKRIRVWDSCQNERFAKVAGGESFREKRSQRKKHRFYRKFRYHNDKYNKFFCTGCGRCSRTCMAKINLKETLDQLVRENV